MRENRQYKTENRSRKVGKDRIVGGTRCEDCLTCSVALGSISECALLCVLLCLLRPTSMALWPNRLLGSVPCATSMCV